MKFLDDIGLTYLWGKITDLFATKANISDLADVATTGSYSDLTDAPQYVICTLSEYNLMASHDVNTYYIIIASGNG